jgi:hypothetical protein
MKNTVSFEDILTDSEGPATADGAEPADEEATENYDGEPKVRPESQAEASAGSDDAPNATERDALSVPPEGCPIEQTVNVPTTPSEIISTLDAELAGQSSVVVEPVVDDETAKPKAGVDRRRSLLREQGLSEETIDKILPIMSVTRKTQRQLPVDFTVCSQEMAAFFSARDDDQITADCIKGIRNDGGKLGPAGMYALMLTRLGIDPALASTAGDLLATKVNHRIVAIRVNVVATVNELKRRRAEREGRDPRTEKYLRVR